MRLACPFCLLIGLPWAAVTLAAPPGPCAQITAACLHAGFTRDGAKEGIGLQADCIAPILQGAAQPRDASNALPQVDPELVAACRARTSKSGQGSASPAQSTANTPIKIMPLGDSITYGTPDPGYGGYRHSLGALLKNDGYMVQFVGSQHAGPVPEQDNEGHPGWTVAQIRNGIDANRWLETSEPDIILLHLGTNDIRLGQSAVAPAHLSALLDDILVRLPRTHVIVAQIIPFRGGPDRDHQSYNDAIPRIVASKGPRVSQVDMRTTILPGDYADGLHPNASGYDKMARAWEPAIRRAVLSRATNPPSATAPAATAVGAAAGPALRNAPGSTTKIERPTERQRPPAGSSQTP
jgi:lysophospholipase L1-like esterase